MTFTINFQNLANLFWISIITLNLYVILLLYRAAKDYRLDRVKKLEDIWNLRQHIELRRQQYTRESKTSMTGPIKNTGNGGTTRSTPKPVVHQRTADSEPILRCESKPYYRLHKLKPSRTNAATRRSYKKMHEIFSSRPDTSNSTILSINKGDVGSHNILYITDSKGRMVQQIPFRESDYNEAFNTVMPNRNQSIADVTKS